MKKHFLVEITSTKTYVVEADNKDDAIEAAKNYVLGANVEWDCDDCKEIAPENVEREAQYYECLEDLEGV